MTLIEILDAHNPALPAIISRVMDLPYAFPPQEKIITWADAWVGDRDLRSFTYRTSACN